MPRAKGRQRILGDISSEPMFVVCEFSNGWYRPWVADVTQCLKSIHNHVQVCLAIQQLA